MTFNIWKYMAFVPMFLGTACQSTVTTRPTDEERRDVSKSLSKDFVDISNPLIGTWTGVAEIDCFEHEEHEPTAPVRELVFKSDGTFAVTWDPIETYQDYWGTYSYDSETTIVALEIVDGNDIPDPVFLNGQAHITDEGKLFLDKIWFGAPWHTDGEPHCASIFREL